MLSSLFRQGLSRPIASRSFAAAAAETAKAASASASASASSPAASADDRIVEYLASLRRSASSNQVLKISKLWHLIDLCKKREHGDHVIAGVKFFQHKGQDFNSDVAKKLVETSIAHGFHVDTAKVFSVYGNRIGSWVESSELDALVSKLVEGGKNFPLSAKVLIVLSEKGVRPQKSSFAAVLAGLGSSPSESRDSLHNSVLDAAKRALTSAEYSDLSTTYPAKTIEEAAK